MKADFYTTYFAVEKNHWLMKVRRKITLDQLARVAQISVGVSENTNKRVLDFGAGSGVLVHELAQGGVESYGVDTSEEAVAYGTAHGVLHLSVLTPHAPLQFPDEYFDCVIAMDVLEHVRDEQGVLSELKRVLKPGGTLVITVPAYMFLWGRQDEVSHHFRRYSLGRLIEVLCTSGGWTIVKRSYFNTLLFPLVALVRVGSWMLNRTHHGSDFDLNNRVLNGVCYGIFSFERHILKHINFPFGVSALLVAKKDA
jgi:2-polyprenyl-3-methyl-5-hydroxy-6-metoxy-1,4-benzoquinol methylase